jgi:uncharacterized membrane protein YkoI
LWFLGQRGLDTQELTVALIAKRNVALIATVIVVAGLGAAGVAAASGGIGDTGSDSEKEQHVVGTIKAPAESATEQDDTQEAAALQALARVTPEEAKATAAQAAGGSATAVEIEEEDGYVVYEVEVTTKSGITDVTVDAGSGKVLLQEQEGPEDSSNDNGSDDGEHAD